MTQSHSCFDAHSNLITKCTATESQQTHSDLRSHLEQKYVLIDNPRPKHVQTATENCIHLPNAHSGISHDMHFLYAIQVLGLAAISIYIFHTRNIRIHSTQNNTQLDR